MNTVEFDKALNAAADLGENLAVLANAGICSNFEATQALLTATPLGGTPFRSAALDAYREATA